MKHKLYTLFAMAFKPPFRSFALAAGIVVVAACGVAVLQTTLKGGAKATGRVTLSPAVQGGGSAVTCAGTNDTAAFSAIITAIGAANGAIIIPYYATPCAVNNLTIPVNVTLDFQGGAGVKVNTGQTLTIVGPIHAISSNTKIFYNALASQGTVSFTGNKSLDGVRPEWWGATADSVDSTTSLVACFSAAQGKLPVLLGVGTYRGNLASTASPSVFIVSSEMTIKGQGRSLSKIKIGPEDSTLASGIGSFFLVNNGVNFTASDFSIEGPTSNANDKWITAIYRVAGNVASTIRLTNIDFTSIPQWVFMDNATTLAGGGIVRAENVNSSTVFNGPDGTLAANLFGDFNSADIRGGRFTTSGTSRQHAFYISVSGNIDMDGVTIGPATGYGLQNYGGTASVPHHASFRNCHIIGPFEDGAGLLVSSIGVTSIVNCEFTGTTNRAGLSIRGTNDTTATVEVIGGKFVNSRINWFDENYGGTVTVQNVAFIDSSIRWDAASTVAGGPFIIDHCDFRGTGDELGIMVYAVKTGNMKIQNSTFNGGTVTYGLIYVSDNSSSRVPNIELTNNTFNNTATIPAVRFAGAGAGAILTGEENSFLFPANAFIVGAAPAYVGLSFKRATKPATVASAGTVDLDWNYNTYRVSGTTTINTIRPNSVDATYPSGSITIIPTGAFAFGSGGNVKAAAGAVTVDRAYRLTYNREAGFWYAEP